MPEAIGMAWAAEIYGADPDSILLGTPNYHLTLPVPDGDEAYNRGHFFYYLGSDLSSSGPVADFDTMISKSYNDGQTGLIWLENYLVANWGDGLAIYYPEFIKSHARNKDYFGPNAAAMSEPSLQVEAPTPEVANTNTESRNVAAIATTYDEADVSFAPTGGWETAEDKDRVYATIIDIKRATRIQDLRLIVNNEILQPSERHVSLVFAQSGEPDNPRTVKVTNVAITPHKSQAQDYELQIAAHPTWFDFAACTVIGEPVQIQIEEEVEQQEILDLMKAGEISVSSSAGNIDEYLIFHPPENPQTVEIELSLPGIDGTTRKAKLGTIEVREKICGILMTVSEKPSAEIIYDAGKDLTQITADGNILLMNSDHIYVNDPKKGWMRIPTSFLLKRKGPGAFPGGKMMANLGGNEFVFTRLALSAAEMFPLDQMKEAATPEGAKVRALMPDAPTSITKGNAQCPNSTGKCPTFSLVGEGGEIKLYYDAGDRLVKVEAQGGWVHFEYGDYRTMDLPDSFISPF